MQTVAVVAGEGIGPERPVVSPGSLDVLVMPKLFGDILSDEPAAVIGGLRLAPSGSYGARKAYSESARGTAPALAPLEHGA